MFTVAPVDAANQLAAFAVGAVVLPRVGRHHLAHRQGLAGRTQPLGLGEQLHHRARAGTVEPIGFELGDELP